MLFVCLRTSAPDSSHSVPVGIRTLEKSILLYHEHLYRRPNTSDLYLQKLENSVTLATTQVFVKFSRFNIREHEENTVRVRGSDCK